MKYKAIIKRPDEQYGHVCHISASLENLQKTVGGYIETVAAVPGVVIICNEEGKLLNLEPNIPYYHDVLRGTIIVIGVRGDNFTDCPMSFRQWKLFLEMQDQIAKGEMCPDGDWYISIDRVREIFDKQTKEQAE